MDEPGGFPQYQTSPSSLVGFLFLIFIYLAVLGLRCSTRDPLSSQQHMESLAVACGS